MTREWKAPGVRKVIRRWKIKVTFEGRPWSMSSRIAYSKKSHPDNSRPKTWVRESSACRIESRALKPALWSSPLNGWGRRANRLFTLAWILGAVSSSRICCRRSGSPQESSPLSSADGLDEGVADRPHQRSGGHLGPTILFQEGRHSATRLQPPLIEAQIQPIDASDIQRLPIAQQLTEALSRHDRRPRLTLGLHTSPPLHAATNGTEP